LYLMNSCCLFYFKCFHGLRQSRLDPFLDNPSLSLSLSFFNQRPFIRFFAKISKFCLQFILWRHTCILTYEKAAAILFFFSSCSFASFLTG
jgi:hypothetical protein